MFESNIISRLPNSKIYIEGSLQFRDECFWRTLMTRPKIK